MKFTFCITMHSTNKHTKFRRNRTTLCCKVVLTAFRQSDAGKRITVLCSNQKRKILYHCDGQYNTKIIVLCLYWLHTYGFKHTVNQITFTRVLCCREFFYIQMEKYSRQALAEGVKNVTDLVVTTDCELYRVLVLHYNRNNQIEVCTRRYTTQYDTRRRNRTGDKGRFLRFFAELVNCSF